MKRIPKRKLTTYKILSGILDTSPRAIGSVLRSNKKPNEIPCYKVVMSNAKLGGYALGLEEKKKRLMADGIPIESEKIKGLEEYLWHH